MHSFHSITLISLLIEASAALLNRGGEMIEIGMKRKEEMGKSI
jgi:hypothetical protein